MDAIIGRGSTQRTIPSFPFTHLYPPLVPGYLKGLRAHLAWVNAHLVVVWLLRLLLSTPPYSPVHAARRLYPIRRSHRSLG